MTNVRRSSAQKNAMRQTKSQWNPNILVHFLCRKAKNRKWRRENDALNWHVNSRRHWRPACRLMKPECRASTPCCRMLHPAAGRRRRELTAAFQWRCPHLRVPCSLHAGFMSIAFLKCRSYFSKCSLHVARITPVCGMQDAAGCSWSGVFNLLKFDRIAKKKKKKLHEPACRAHASLVWTRHKAANRWAKG